MRCKELAMDVEENFCKSNVKEGSLMCISCNERHRDTLIIEKKGGDIATPEDRKCKTEGCDKYAVKDGLCKACSKQQLPNKAVTKPSVKKRYACSTPGCGRSIQKDGLCYKCFKEKTGHSPYGKGASVKKKAVKKSVSVKAPSNAGASVSADELQALIRKAGKEALRVEIMPLIEKILEVLNN